MLDTNFFNVQQASSVIKCQSSICRKTSMIQHSFCNTNSVRRLHAWPHAVGRVDPQGHLSSAGRRIGAKAPTVATKKRSVLPDLNGLTLPKIESNWKILKEVIQNAQEMLMRVRTTHVKREKQILSVNQWLTGQDEIEKYTADISWRFGWLASLSMKIVWQTCLPTPI